MSDMEWIDVKEKLPGDFEDVLVFWVKRPMPTVNYYGIAFHDGTVWRDEQSGKRDAEDNPDFCYITHWMPLPEEPKTTK